MLCLSCSNERVKFSYLKIQHNKNCIPVQHQCADMPIYVFDVFHEQYKNLKECWCYWINPNKNMSIRTTMTMLHKPVYQSFDVFVPTVQGYNLTQTFYNMGYILWKVCWKCCLVYWLSFLTILGAVCQHSTYFSSDNQERVYQYFISSSSSNHWYELGILSLTWIDVNPNTDK